MSKNEKFEGIARNVNWFDSQRHIDSQIQDHYVGLAFRLEQADEMGNITDVIQVQVERKRGRKAYPLKGTLLDGDEVMVQGQVNGAGVLIPQQITNVRTGAAVISGKDPISFLGVIKVMFALIMVGIFFVAFIGAALFITI
jgi:hypothetical protein